MYPTKIMPVDLLSIGIFYSLHGMDSKLRGITHYRLVVGKQQKRILENIRQPHTAQVINKEYLVSVGYDNILERYKVMYSSY